MIYTWRFKSSGQTVEVQRKAKDINVPPWCHECPRGCKYGCESSDWERVISKTNFSLVGGGWAKQGYTK